jgi:pantoate--beta-alanine ligase
MKVIKSVSEIHEFASKLKNENKKIAFVPTMGFLHDGHLSLVREAKKHGDILILSIFVNPKQFGENEDLDKYPRDLERDLSLCEKEGVDIVFTPTKNDFYDENFQTNISVQKITQTLCGLSRPTHFDGVTTVVLKLFNVVRADVAIFGQKDFQQYLVIKQMVDDLFHPTRIIIAPIVREKDGLAMSSRNKYLSDEERENARVLSKSLQNAKKLIESGEKNSEKIISEIKEQINSVPSKIDYIEIKDQSTLENIQKIKNPIVIALAVFIGNTRLIDNILIEPER